MLGFSHLLPHSLHTLEAANINPMYAFQATVVGYLVIFVMEKLLFDSHAIIHDVMDEATPMRRPSIMVPPGSDDPLPSSYSVDGAEAPDRASLSSQADSDAMPRPPAAVERPRSSSVVSQQSAVVLLLAMAVHSLFETVALGMAPDRTSAVIMATSVALHQPAESLALLVAFLKTSMERKVIMRYVSM